jgi:hypothetical protein
LKTFEDSAFDIAIVDIFLERTSGFELIGLMRERVPDLLVVAISGMATLDFVPASPEFSGRCRNYERRLAIAVPSSKRHYHKRRLAILTNLGSKPC